MSPRLKFLWPDERTEALKKLIADGYTSGQAAKELGVTRNSVIGKARRMKTEPNQSADDWQWKRKPFLPGVSQNKPPKTPKLPKARRSPASPERESTLQDVFLQASEATDIAAEMITGGVTIVELENHHCRWPLSGHPKEVPPEKFLYCGKNRLEPLPYCGGHCRMAYRSEREVREIERWRANLERRWVAA